MTEKKKEDNNIKNLLIVGGALIILALFGLIVYRSVYQKKPEIMTVKFGDSENEVEVNRNGEVTIRTPFGVYKQKWDKDKLTNFFNRINDLDFSGLGEFVGEGLAIELTFGNGTDLRIKYDDGLSDIVDELQEELDKTYEEEDENFDFGKFDPNFSREHGYDIEVERKDYEEESDDEDESGSSDGSDDGQEDEINDPWAGDNTETTKELECKQVDPKTGKVVIISNTVCGR